MTNSPIPSPGDVDPDQYATPGAVVGTMPTSELIEGLGFMPTPRQIALVKNNPDGQVLILSPDGDAARVDDVSAGTDVKGANPYYEAPDPINARD